MKEKNPVKWKLEVFSVMVGIIVGGYIFLTEPANDMSEEMVRKINMMGLWLQTLGAIVIAFQVLRGPLAARQKDDFIHARKELSNQFILALDESNNANKLEKIKEFERERIELESKYFTPLNFDRVSRYASLMGLSMVVAGYLLQLSVS